MYKEAVMAWIEVLSQHLSSGAEENHEDSDRLASL
jgi:hypothetical protein